MLTATIRGMSRFLYKLLVFILVMHQILDNMNAEIINNINLSDTLVLLYNDIIDTFRLFFCDVGMFWWMADM